MGNQHRKLIPRVGLFLDKPEHILIRPLEIEGRRNVEELGTLGYKTSKMIESEFNGLLWLEFGI